MKKLIYSFLFLGAITALGSCKEDSYEDLIPEQYDKILYLKTYGQQTIELFDDGSQVDYSLTVVKTGSNPEATAQAQVKIMSQAEVDKDTRYQGNNYKVLSSACYTYKSEPLELTSADAYKQVKMKLSPAKILEEIAETKDENPNYVYIIPFRLSSPNDQVNQDKKDLILKLNVTKLSIYFKKGSQTVNLNTVTGDEWAFEAGMAMVSGVQNTWNFTAQIEVDRSDEALNTYNTANGTAYLMIPEAAIVNINEGVFEAGNNEAAAAIRIRRAGLAKGYTYLVPLKLKPITEIETISINEKLHYIILEYPLDPEADRIALRVDMLSDPFNCAGGDGTTLADLINTENLNTYYHTIWGRTDVGNAEWGQPFDITFDSPLKSIQFKYRTRASNANAVPRLIKLYVGNNANNLTLLDIIGDNENLPTGAGDTYTSKVIISTEEFTFLRFSVMESALGATIGAGEDTSWAMGQFEIWGSN